MIDTAAVGIQILKDFIDSAFDTVDKRCSYDCMVKGIPHFRRFC